MQFHMDDQFSKFVSDLTRMEPVTTGVVLQMSQIYKCSLLLFNKR